MGTFDPPHNGHLHVISDLINNNRMDMVIVVPTIQNPTKEKSVEFSYRYHMLCRMTDFIPDCIVSNIETKLNPPYYSYKTLESLKQKITELDINAELYLIIGDDIDITTWKNSEWILNNFLIFKYSRDTINISSTFVRELLKNNAIVEPYIPKTVIDYINKNNLYKLKN